MAFGSGYTSRKLRQSALFHRLVTCFFFGSLVLNQPLSAQIKNSEKELIERYEQAKRSGSKSQLSEATINLGKWYVQEKKYEKGLTYLLRAKKLNPEDSVQYTGYYAGFATLFKEIGAYNASIEYEKKILRQKNASLGHYFSAANIGIQYTYLSQMDSALHYYDMQLSVSRKMNDYIAVASSFNNKGIAYFENDDYPNALSMFNESLAILEKNRGKKSPNFQGESVSFGYRVLENKGRCLFFLERYSEAIPILEKTTAVMDPGMVNENRYALIFSYMHTNQKPKATGLIKALSQGINGKPITEKIRFAEICLELAIWNSDLAGIKRNNNWLKTLRKQQQNEQRISGNQMSNLISRYLIWESEGIIRNEKNQKKFYKNELRLEETKNSYFFFFLIGILLLFGSSAFLYIQIVKNKRSALALERERLLLVNDRHQMKIRLQEQSLTEFAIDFNKNQEYEALIIDRLKNISELNSNSISAEVRSLLAELKQKQYIDKRAEDLVVESQQLLAEFRNTLLERHNGLTKSDIQLCYLLRLELSNKEISVIRNVTPNSIKIFKNRLKNKLGLRPEESLTEYLKSIH
jgi:tetratricopeptide (TPR) repeat protein